VPQDVRERKGSFFTPEIWVELSQKYIADIREYFQGRNEKGKMNTKSEDKKYNELIKNLRDCLTILAQKIEPKVYEYGFLKK